MGLGFSALWRKCVRLPGPAERWTLAHPALDDWAERAEALKKCGDGELAAAAQALQARMAAKEIGELAAQVEAGALATEAIRRTAGVELFATQRLAGLVLSQGMIAQMQTGEGKTYSGGPAILYAALQGRGVHMMLPNSYLAERDESILKPAFKLLGISTGLLKEKDNDRARQIAYRCDVTYGAGYEFGFDYLRDQLSRITDSSQGLGSEFSAALAGRVSPSATLRQRELAFAIIDEADSILLDEATVPMILSGGQPKKLDDERPFQLAQQIAEKLREGMDFERHPSQNRIELTETGLAQVIPALTGLGQVKLCRPWRDYVEKALSANHLFQRDVHYVIVGGKLVIVDESTGRLYADRTWRDGLHQAIEAKERLPLSGQSKTQAQISRQRFLGQYDVLAGMTGTAGGSEAELREAYDLAVVNIPTRIPTKRQQLPDRYFIHREAKWAAAVEAIAQMQRTGRPVLVGSRTIQASEAIAKLLAERGIPCQVLNGKQSASEAELVSKAGQRGMVTVATNMAGRGTDIRLGPGVSELGGLHLVGLERNTSQRADAQLAGRVARQGDPGSYQFFVSADDALLQKFAPRRAWEMSRLPHSSGEISSDQSRCVGEAQRAADAAGALVRQRLRAQDAVQAETISRLFGVH